MDPEPPLLPDDGASLPFPDLYAPNLSLRKALNLSLPKAPNLSLPKAPNLSLLKAPNLSLPKAPNLSLLKAPPSQFAESYSTLSSYLNESNDDSGYSSAPSSKPSFDENSFHDFGPSSNESSFHDFAYLTAPSSKPSSNPSSSDNSILPVNTEHYEVKTNILTHPGTFRDCSQRSKRFVRAYTPRCHLRSHIGDRPFAPFICGKAFTRCNDCKRHEGLHSGDKKFVCKGSLKDGNNWGCGRRFARADALGRHFRSETWRICFQTLIEEEIRNEIQSISRNLAGYPLPDVFNPSSARSASSPPQSLYGRPRSLLQEYSTHDEEVDKLDKELDELSRVYDADDSNSVHWEECEEFEEAELSLDDLPFSKQPQDPTITTHIVDQCAEGGCETTKTSNLPDQTSEDGSPSTTTIDERGDEATASRDDPLSLSPVSANGIEIGDNLMEDSRSESIVREAEETTNVNSAPEPPNSDSTSATCTSMAPIEECATPSTILDEDITDTEEELSEPETSFSSRDSSTSLWPSTPTSAEQNGLFAPILDESLRQIVDRLMLEVRVLLNRQIGIRSRTDSAQSSRSQSFEQDAARESAGNSGNNRKRSRDDDSGSEMPEDGSGDGSPAKRQKINVPAANDKTRKLACPYYKRNPGLHQKYRSCAGPGWSSCHRVKEHLYRRHRLPNRCARCCASFPNDKELSDHLRQPESCIIQRAEAVEGMDKVQEAQLRSRKKFAGTEEQRWKEMFLILFPDDDEDTIPSPHHEADVDLTRQSDQLAEYDRYMARELPRLVRTQLEAIVHGAWGPLESGLQSQLIDIIRNCQWELFRAYAANQNPQASITSLGPSSNEPAPLDEPPTDVLADINAFFPPPFIPDNNYQFTYEDLLQNSTGLCPPVRPLSFSDSAYSSQNTTFPSSLDALTQNSFVGGQPPDGTTDVLSRLPGSDVPASDMQQDDRSGSNNVEPWPDFNEDDWTH